MAAVPYITDSPILTYDGGVVMLDARSGEAEQRIALSVATAAKLEKRLGKLLRRYAEGEQHIIEGKD